MSRPIGALIVSAASFLLLGSAVPVRSHSADMRAPTMTEQRPSAVASPSAALVPTAPPEALAPPPPSPPTTEEALREGVLIVVSIPSQRMFVFQDGKAWDSAPVSTGRPGYDTPAGVFPILQKKVHHRSNLYDDAPMPYMQRLTWDGVALHAGNVPGYPASHGCIRLPREFARKLYGITHFSSTAVLVADEPLGSADEAQRLVSGDAPTPAFVRAERRTPAEAGEGQRQTIQLAAASSADNAAALWQQLVRRRPELDRLDHQIIPATVHSRKVFRLRASGPDAHSTCEQLASGGVACLKIGQ